MSHEAVAAVTALIELGMIAQDDIVKCLKKALSEPETQRKPWVSLTPDEFNDISSRYNVATIKEFVQEIEFKLREKNT